MLIVSSWLCPKCTFILLHTTLNLKVCKINFERGGGCGGPPEEHPYDVSRGQKGT